MCYKTVLSTSSGCDLQAFNTPLLHFEREMPGVPEEAHLRYPQRWFVGSQYGCSCGFRHLTSYELGFAAPEDWMPEDADDITASLQLVAVVRSLQQAGEQLDCIDAWTDDEPRADAHVEALVVELGSLADAQFCLFAGYRFDLR